MNKSDGNARKFRPDIEGLRAISIISVVFYHAKITGFSGGFVGVDIFFVISGFLICGLLFEEASSTGRIDLWKFWSRRVRRLLPNALLTLFAVLLVGIVMTPGIYRENLSREVISAALYLSNFYFARKSVDYFQSDDPHSPVLHFWSLNVEEQFYVIWPLVLFFVCYAYRKSLIPVTISLLAVIWLSSFLASVMLLQQNQPLAFFHTETRAWELATGGLLAAFAITQRRRLFKISPAFSAYARMMIKWSGLLLIVIAIFFLDDKAPYPGSRALLPTMGAALVIGAGLFANTQQTKPGGLLESKLFQWIGARSYSWYLWHWPILVFVDSAFPDRPLLLILSLPLSLALSSVVYAKLEDPLRKGLIFKASYLRSIVYGTATILLCVTSAFLFKQLPHFGGSASASLLAKIEIARKDHGRNYADKCHLDQEAVEHPPCVYGVATATKRAVLFGDSHAAQWFSTLQKASLAKGWKFNAWTKSSCPAVDVTIWDRRRKNTFEECDLWRAKILANLTGEDRPNVVLISSLVDYSGWIEDRKTGVVLSKKAGETEWRAGLKRTLQILTAAGIPTVVIRDTPQVNKNYDICLAKGGGITCDRPRSQALSIISPEQEVVSKFGNKVIFLDLSDQICEGEVCPVIKNNLVVYKDYHHLSSTFAATLNLEFEAVLSKISNL